MVKGKVGRGVPDVAYNAGVNGGVLTVCTVCDPSDPGSVFLFGGTSAGTPQWAGLAAIADQMAHHRLGGINKALYSIANSSSKYRSAFHDVTVGNNDVAEIGGRLRHAQRLGPGDGSRHAQRGAAAAGADQARRLIRR